MRLIAQFGGVLLFWAIYAIAGLKPAIASTLALLVVELARRGLQRERVPVLFVSLSAMSIALGLIDLTLASPVAIKFEGVATNLVFASLFSFGSMRAKPLMQEFAEAARGPFAADDAGRTRFFRALGWLWAAYFVSRALVCLLTALWLPLPQALAARSVYALVTIVPMVAISIGGKRVFLALRERGWFA